MPYMYSEMQNKLSKTRDSPLESMGQIISSRCPYMDRKKIWNGATRIWLYPHPVCAWCLAVASLETHKPSNQQVHNLRIFCFIQSNKNGFAISTWKFI